MQNSIFFELQSQFCLAFIVATAVFGATRLLLRSKFAHYNDSRFPTGVHISLFLMGTVLLLPYVAWPADEAVWNYVRIFNVIYYPMGFTMGFVILNRCNPKGRWTRVARLSAATSLCIIAVTLLAMLTGHSRLLVDSWLAISTATGIVGAGQTVIVAALTWRLKKAIDSYNVAVYSNQDDFYYKYTKVMIFYPTMWMLIMWVMFFSGSRWVMIVSALPLIASNITIMTKLMLRPDRLTVKSVTATSAQDGPDESVAGSADSKADNYDDAQAEVIRVIGTRYLESSLTRTEVLADIPYGKKTEAGRFITQIGFYDLVNMFRLKHAELYRQAYPNATQDAVAEASGFASRFALRRAQKRNIDTESNLLRGFNPTIVM